MSPLRRTGSTSPVGRAGKGSSMKPLSNTKGGDETKTGKPEEPMGQSTPEFSPDYGLKEVDWKGAAAGYMQVEATVILKWLNRFVVSRAFDTEAFPGAIIENHGKLAPHTPRTHFPTHPSSSTALNTPCLILYRLILSYIV